MMFNKLSQYVDWSEIDEMVNTLSNIISKSSRTFTNITTISRGGLIPSRLLADRLGISTILVDQKAISSKTLFVDDIFDSGKTFKEILSKVDNPSNLVFATLFARCGKTYPPQLTYARETEDNTYVVFPWDIIEFQKDVK